ncbi:uncharacterized protein VICG_00757 [Vittaforma corneae ATCC 50505]|uniref:Uncharacterized protein n=1 Tax=Vittaforma corneae (strain ATCC 50505) TaxID=993615 RepID=L2GMS4_VITCO|nr:uncharacterized protein VICG_00757 [Vittaforma corneae ATCC 50505]ELA42116.1 hypothetical protein VICG_00757 [Vittaforma corneae ATCC 50505]
MNTTYQNMTECDYTVHTETHTWNLFSDSRAMDMMRRMWESCLHDRLLGIWNLFLDAINLPESQQEVEITNQAIELFDLGKKIDQNQTTSQKIQDIFSQYRTDRYFENLFRECGIVKGCDDDTVSTLLDPFKTLNSASLTMYLLFSLVLLNILFRNAVLSKMMYSVCIVNAYMAGSICLVNLKVAYELMTSSWPTEMPLGLEYLVRLYPYRWIYLQIFVMAVFIFYHKFYLKSDDVQEKRQNVFKKIFVIIVIILGAFVQGIACLFTKNIFLTQSTADFFTMFCLINICMMAAIIYSSVTMLKASYRYFIKRNTSE